ncbi:TetR/AcrR family transcriptional regulator [Kitasatospora sp. NPDC086801]|uniref:TetR/AcrR family transcriptional regulator n=1 Tax=Kitasatospora sp. NPDC086801 TaxID=3364066 RepID=UPI0038124272
MGHREDLLIGAKRCLQERGYAHTTARDIVAVSGTNLASIGYHFGSKEALLNAAMMSTFEDWANELERALSASIHHGETPFERFESMVAEVIESVKSNRAMWAASVDSFPEAERSPELRRQLATAHTAARRGAVALIYELSENLIDDERVRTVGSLYLTMVSGLMLQWLTDPQNAPEATDLTAAMRALTAPMLSAKPEATPAPE